MIIQTLEDILPFLAAPRSCRELELVGTELRVPETGVTFPIVNNIPLLFPIEFQEYFLRGKLDKNVLRESPSLGQYLTISAVKWESGYPQNSDYTKPWFLRHLELMGQLLQGVRGLVLDIGCDDIENSQKIFPETVRYVGLDPDIRKKASFRVGGLAEFLPFVDSTFDAVCFNTSLDHVFDWHEAVEEALRVLKKSGSFYLSSLVWSNRAQLYNDLVHFHHFREFELLGKLEQSKLQVVDCFRSPWKDEPHRQVLFVHAKKV